MLANVSEHDIQAVRRIYTALTRWDVDDLVADMTHDVEWTLPDPLPWGGTHHGPDGVRTFARIFRDHVEAGDRIIALGRLRGRARESGHDFEVEFAHVWALTDGVASRVRVYYDTAPILAALEGRSPPEASAQI
jgi:ketosteroid isomerase-like protein